MVLFVKLTSRIFNLSICTLNVHILKLNIPHNMLVYNGTVKVSVDFQVYEGLDNMTNPQTKFRGVDPQTKFHGVDMTSKSQDIAQTTFPLFEP